jgi:hypothetical protein
MTFWGLPVVHLKYRTPLGYEVDTTTNAKAFELMHVIIHDADNDNDLTP